jgi:hypothetical protein
MTSVTSALVIVIALFVNFLSKCDIPYGNALKIFWSKNDIWPTQFNEGLVCIP